MSFTKHDAGKPRLSLYPPAALTRIVDVLEFGAAKYTKENWKKCEDPERYLEAVYRHLLAHLGGERLDPETGLSHLAHIGCNIGFLLWFEEQGEIDEQRKLEEAQQAEEVGSGQELREGLRKYKAYEEVRQGYREEALPSDSDWYYPRS